MSVAAAKRAIAALLLNKPASPEGADGVDFLTSRVAKDGHKEADIHVALFEMADGSLVRIEEKVDCTTYSDSPSFLPERVFSRPATPPRVIEHRYQVVWPLPALKEWWRNQATFSAPSSADVGKPNQGAAVVLVAAINKFLTAVHSSSQTPWDSAHVSGLVGEIMMLCQILSIPVDYERLIVVCGSFPAAEVQSRFEQHRQYLLTLRRAAEVSADHQTRPTVTGTPRPGFDLASTKLSGQTDRPADAKKKKRNRLPSKLPDLLKFKKALKKAEQNGDTMHNAALEITEGDERKAEALLRAWRRHKDHPGLA